MRRGAHQRLGKLSSKRLAEIQRLYGQSPMDGESCPICSIGLLFAFSEESGKDKDFHTPPLFSLSVYMDYWSGRETVEVSSGGIAVGADILAVHEIAAVQLGQLLAQ